MEEVKESINPDYKAQIIHAIEYHYPHAKIYLFGSRARKTHREGADVDIALDNGSRIPLGEMSRTRVTLENLRVPLMVDIVDMHRIPDNLKETILKEGVVWKG